MPSKYTDEFKIEAVKQVPVNGYSVKETAERLGIHFESLRSWIKKYGSEESIVQKMKSDKESKDCSKSK